MLQVGQAVYFFYFCGTKFTNMNLHEYQGKEILASFGVGIQRGLVAHTADEAVEAAKQLTETTGTGWHVSKHKSMRVDVEKGEASSWLKTLMR